MDSVFCVCVCVCLGVWVRGLLAVVGEGVVDRLYLVGWIEFV